MARDPVAIAASLRRRIAAHDVARRARQQLIIALSDYVAELKIQNIVEGKVVGRLRRKCHDLDAEADRTDMVRRGLRRRRASGWHREVGR